MNSPYRTVPINYSGVRASIGTAPENAGDLYIANNEPLGSGYQSAGGSLASNVVIQPAYGMNAHVPQTVTERLTDEVVRLRVENQRLLRKVNDAEMRRMEPLVVVQAGGREARAYLLQSGTLLIKVGCHVAEWDWWVQNGDRVADEHGRPHEKEDLRAFLLFVKTFAAPYLRAREQDGEPRPEPYPTDPADRARQEMWDEANLRQRKLAEAARREREEAEAQMAMINGREKEADR